VIKLSFSNGTTIDKSQVINVVCLFCKKPVKKRQRKKGKAICYDCNYRIFVKPFRTKSKRYYGYQKDKEFREKRNDIFLRNIMRKDFYEYV
jgi:DNA-directed RNA polymerase subunit RPC12/RpoP